MYNFPVSFYGVKIEEGMKFSQKGKKNKPVLSVVELFPPEQNHVAVYDGKEVTTMRLDVLVQRYRKV